MHANHLIFSKDARGSRLYKVSPLLFPQQQLYNKYYLPEARDLPAHGLELRFQVFDFGFGDPSKLVGPYDTAFADILMGRDFLAETLTGTSAAVATANPPVAGQPGANTQPAYLFNFLHTHNGVQRQWASKSGSNVEGVGNASDPMTFKSPALVLQGDTLTCVVQNLSNSGLQVQILIVGGEF